MLLLNPNFKVFWRRLSNQVWQSNKLLELSGIGCFTGMTGIWSLVPNGHISGPAKYLPRQQLDGKKEKQ
jgi:hypothetical protein